MLKQYIPLIVFSSLIAVFVIAFIIVRLRSDDEEEPTNTREENPDNASEQNQEGSDQTS